MSVNVVVLGLLGLAKKGLNITATWYANHL